MPAAKDFYTILKVAPEADQEVIQAAYRALAKKYHPDTQGSRTEKMMVLFNEAYETLSDPSRRADYDKHRKLKVQRRANARKKPEQNGNEGSRSQVRDESFSPLEHHLRHLLAAGDLEGAVATMFRYRILQWQPSSLIFFLTPSFDLSSGFQQILNNHRQLIEAEVARLYPVSPLEQELVSLLNGGYYPKAIQTMVLAGILRGQSSGGQVQWTFQQVLGQRFDLTLQVHMPHLRRVMEGGVPQETQEGTSGCAGGCCSVLLVLAFFLILIPMCLSAIFSL